MSGLGSEGMETNEEPEQLETDSLESELNPQGLSEEEMSATINKLDQELQQLQQLTWQEKARQTKARARADQKQEKIKHHMAIALESRAQRLRDSSWHERRRDALEAYHMYLGMIDHNIGEALEYAAWHADVKVNAVRRWRDAHVELGSNFWSQRNQCWGRHPKTRFVLHDKEVQSQARQWVRERACPKHGKPMKLYDFQQYCNNVLIPEHYHPEDQYKRNMIEFCSCT